MPKVVTEKDEQVVESVNVPTVEDMTKYIKQETTVSGNQRLVVRHLWGRNFRTKVYIPTKQLNSALTFEKMVDSQFVKIETSKRGKMKLVIVR